MDTQREEVGIIGNCVKEEVKERQLFLLSGLSELNQTKRITGRHHHHRLEIKLVRKQLRKKTSTKSFRQAVRLRE